MFASSVLKLLLTFYYHQVAFGAVTFVDDGQTSIGRGARITPAVAGRHLGNHLQNYCVQWSEKKGISTLSYTEIQQGDTRRCPDNYRVILTKYISASMEDHLCRNVRKRIF